MPMFEKTFEKYKYPFRKIFENHIEEKGFSVKKLWEEIDKAIVATVINTESYIMKKVGCIMHLVIFKEITNRPSL